MVSQRQRLARKRFKAEHPDLFPKSDPSSRDPKSKKLSKKSKRKFKPEKGSKTISKNKFKRHPLRVPGMKPGESCFICKAIDHIAKLCPEKAKWERNKICLHCRQRGHSLKNCPQNDEGNDKKLCYNCGEVGHSLSKCPYPIQDGGTKFANCFICNERGHLSQNCPKNTHGIYPKGGSCKICGGINHLAKNCPNKGNKLYDVADMTDKQQSNGSGAGWQGKLTIFGSGDDLEDDFITEEAKGSNKVNHTQPAIDSVTKGNEAKITCHKKKTGPKIVNFLGR